MTQGNNTAVGDDHGVNPSHSADLTTALIATQEALLLTEAVRQIDQALFCAQQGRADLVTVFTSMAKLMLLEGNGSGSESEYWLSTTRSAEPSSCRTTDMPSIVQPRRSLWPKLSSLRMPLSLPLPGVTLAERSLSAETRLKGLVSFSRRVSLLFQK